MDKTVPYLELLKRSWKIVWRNRYLWWFGFFIALINISGLNYFFNLGKSENTINNQEIAEWIFQNSHWIALGITIFSILYVFLVILNIIGRGALIYSVNQKAEGKSASFKLGFKKGKEYFWKIFLIALVLGLFMLSSVIILAVPVIFLFSIKNYLIGLFMAALAGLIIIPLIILMVYVKIYAYLYAALGQLNFWSAVEKAYNLFIKNLASSLIMGVLFIPINIFLGIISLAVVIITIISFMIIGLVLFFIAGKIGVMVIAAIGIICLVILLLTIRSVYEAFNQTAWVLFFREIAKPAVTEPVTEPEPEPAPIIKSLPIIESEKE